jgi:hypothetical protein
MTLIIFCVYTVDYSRTLQVYGMPCFILRLLMNAISTKDGRTLLLLRREKLIRLTVLFHPVPRSH